MSEPVTLPGTETHRLQSPSVPDMLRIQVGLPLGYENSNAAYPAIYLVDGQWYFPQVFASAMGMAYAEEIPPVVVVGIGYEPVLTDRAAELRRVNQLRCRDLTPTHDPSEWWRVAGAAEPIVNDSDTGHAQDFMKALEHDIKPLVSSRYRISPNEAVLAGFSLGALFALHALLSRPGESFRGYICGSPSLWWHDGVMFERERQYAAGGSDLATNLFLSVGALESTGGAQSARMVENVQAFAHQLATRNYPSLRCEHKIFEDDTHSTAAGPAFAHGLRAMFASKPPHEDLKCQP